MSSLADSRLMRRMRRLTVAGGVASTLLVLPAVSLAQAVAGDAGSDASRLDSRIVQIECPGFDRQATAYQSRFFEPMQSWAAERLRRLGARKVLYPFSGADVVTAVALFEGADHLILVADQQPEWEFRGPASPDQVAKECDTQAFFVRRGYFRTNDLEGKDSVRPRFVKLLAYSVTLAGARIESVWALSLNPDGTARLATSRGSSRDGIRLAVRTREGRALTVDYLKMDLSNRGLRPDGPQHRYLALEATDAVFLKAASHLLQSPRFSALADLVANRARIVVQDETGLDIDKLRSNFVIESYGVFNAPHPIWQESASGKRLRDFMLDQPALQPLPFVLGYEKPSGSVLLVGARRGGS